MKKTGEETLTKINNLDISGLTNQMHLFGTYLLSYHSMAISLLLLRHEKTL